MKKAGEEPIAILAGGRSCEREISLLSGKAVFEALASRGFSVVFVDPVNEFIGRLKNESIRIVFLALHGSFGEDGSIQRLLDEEGIVYTGSDAKASELAFDKARAQSLFQKSGIPVPGFQILKENQAAIFPAHFSIPFVVKPSQCGSSVGISIVSEVQDYKKACELAFCYSDTLLIEEYKVGRELTVGILGDEALPIVEVVPGRKFYDYEAKYQDSATSYEFPARLNPKKTLEIQALALQAFRVLGCQVMARVDIILDRDEKPFVLEVNTIPGLMGKSLLPKAAKASGIDFPDLCARIMELSLKKPRVSERLLQW